MGDILFLAHRVPFPPDRGDKIRSFHLLKASGAARRASISPAFADDEADVAHLAALREALGRRWARPMSSVRRDRKVGGRRRRAASRQAGVAGAVRQRRRCAASSTRIAGRAAGSRRSSPFPARWRSSCPSDRGRALRHGFRRRRFGQVRRLCRRRRAADGAGSIAREARLLAASRRAVAARADVSLFVSEAEAALFRARSGLRGADIRALGNGVDLDFFDPAAAFAPVDGAARRR